MSGKNKRIMISVDEELYKSLVKIKPVDMYRSAFFYNLLMVGVEEVLNLIAQEELKNVKKN